MDLKFFVLNSKLLYYLFYLSIEKYVLCICHFQSTKKRWAWITTRTLC